MGTSTDAERLALAVKNPGRFILAPTTTSGPWPYGGTSLGLVTECELDWDVLITLKRDPASGAIVEASRGVETPILTCVIDGVAWDEDVLAAVFTRTSGALPVTSPAEVQIGGTAIPAVVPAWQPVLFAALDPRHKSIYFRRPIPLLSLRSAVAFAQNRKAGLPVKFIPTPDTAWATTPPWQISRLENITL